jgi:hypothetical protein
MHRRCDIADAVTSRDEAESFVRLVSASVAAKSKSALSREHARFIQKLGA